MTDTKKEETPAGYPEGWQPEEIRTIEPQPLPEDQREPEPLSAEEATEWNRLQSFYPHDAVLIEYDDKGKPSFVTPDGEKHEKTKAEKTAEKAEEKAEKEEAKADAKATKSDAKK